MDIERIDWWEKEKPPFVWWCHNQYKFYKKWKMARMGLLPPDDIFYQQQKNREDEQRIYPSGFREDGTER